ncbi:MAG: hypothetical protein NC926_11330 [Candidatus Omnitrophica bacterium]|nr:hypothetical protein [Candidatus Omnitrophota bacterium]
MNIGKNKYISVSVGNLYEALQNKIHSFSLEFRFLDFVDKEQFKNPNDYKNFLNLLVFLKIVDLIKIETVNKTTIIGFRGDEKNVEILKNVFNNNNFAITFINKIGMVMNSFIGYDFETFLNNCKFEIVFPDDKLIIYLPDGTPLLAEKSLIKAIKEGRQRKAVNMIYSLFLRYYVNLAKIGNVKKEFLIIKSKYDNASFKCSEIAEMFIYYLIKTVDRIVDDEKLLLAYDNAIYLDESKGKFTVLRKTISKVLKRMIEDDRRKFRFSTILSKLVIPYEKKNIEGVVEKDGKKVKVSKKAITFDYKKSLFDMNKNFVVPLKKHIEWKNRR